MYDITPAHVYFSTSPCKDKWNHRRIVVKSDNTVKHWLSECQVVEYERRSAIYDALIARRKYAQWENFGMAPKGHMRLQDHGNEEHFRRIKIKEL